jgi:hypothetical protein
MLAVSAAFFPNRAFNMLISEVSVQIAVGVKFCELYHITRQSLKLPSHMLQVFRAPQYILLAVSMPCGMGFKEVVVNCKQ